MKTFYEDICKLFDLELYDDVIALYEISYAEQSGLSNVQTASIVSIVAESYYQRDNFVKSQDVSLGLKRIFIGQSIAHYTVFYTWYWKVDVVVQFSVCTF